jgi:hypothetical protein
MTVPFSCSRVLLCLLLASPGAALAQNAPSPPAKPAASTPPAKQGMQMDAIQLATLIKSTIMALQHANQTGNYSVLRDMGTPLFRERFDQARLTAVFWNLRQRNANLAPVLFLPPNLTKQPELKEGKVLHVVGDFPTQPLKIQFELLFLQIDGVWRVDGLAVDAVSAQAAASAPAQPNPPTQPNVAAEPSKNSPPTPQQKPASSKPAKDSKK